MAKRHGHEFWRAHFEAWHRSELTQREHCASRGLGEKAFYRWQRNKRRKLLHRRSHSSPWFRSASAHRPLGASFGSTALVAGESNCRWAGLRGWPTCCGTCHDAGTDPSLAGGRTHRHACRHYPHAWLKDTLEKSPVWPNSRSDELLPLKAALP